MKNIFFPDDPKDSFLDRAVDLINPDLRPVPPQPSCPRSMQIYKTHKLVISLAFNVAQDRKIWYNCQLDGPWLWSSSQRARHHGPSLNPAEVYSFILWKKNENIRKRVGMANKNPDNHIIIEKCIRFKSVFLTGLSNN